MLVFHFFAIVDWIVGGWKGIRRRSRPGIAGTSVDGECRSRQFAVRFRL